MNLSRAQDMLGGALGLATLATVADTPGGADGGSSHAGGGAFGVMLEVWEQEMCTHMRNVWVSTIKTPALHMPTEPLPMTSSHPLFMHPCIRRAGCRSSQPEINHSRDTLVSLLSWSSTAPSAP